MSELIRILYVDDYPLDRELVRDALEKEAGGFQVVEAASRLEFESALAQGEFDLVLTDFNILGFEGLQVIDAVHARNPQLPVVIVTGTGSEEVAVEAMKRGACDYIIKTPKHIRRLAHTIRAVLKNVHLQEKHKQAEDEIRYHASLVESVSEAIISTDLDFTIRTWNHAAKTIYGWESEEVVGKSVFEVIPTSFPHDDLEGVVAQLRRDGFWNGEAVQKRRDGAPLNILSAVSQIHDSAGNLTGVVAVNRDITDRVRAEKIVQQHLQRLRALRTIDQTITSSLDMGITLNVLLEQVILQLSVDAAAILLLNRPMQMFEYAAGRGFDFRALQDVKLRMGEGHAGRAALERQTVHLSNVIEAGGVLARALVRARESFAAYYAVPLIAKGQVKGVLEIFHRTPLDPDPEWLDFLETLAGQAAIAIDGAQLFDGLQRSNAELTQAYDATIEGWSRAMDLRDKETEGHTLRVTEVTVHLARAVGMKGEELIHVRRGALLHDIGKLGVPDNILLKPGALTEEEWEIMRQHPQNAYEMLIPIAYLRPVLDIPYCHHEKWDGTGYPRGLKGEQIPLPARLFAVVDVWDALRSDRPYRAAWQDEKVLGHIRSLAGTHFDPKAVDLFMQVLDKMN